MLTNERGNPLGKDAFRKLLKDALLKKTKLREYEEGLDSVSFLRIRETNIDFLHRRRVKRNVNMAVHGILTVTSMKRFEKLPTDGEIKNILSSLL